MIRYSGGSSNRTSSSVAAGDEEWYARFRANQPSVGADGGIRLTGSQADAFKMGKNPPITANTVQRTITAPAGTATFRDLALAAGLTSAPAAGAGGRMPAPPSNQWSTNTIGGQAPPDVTAAYGVPVINAARLNKRVMASYRKVARSATNEISDVIAQRDAALAALQNRARVAQTPEELALLRFQQRQIDQAAAASIAGIKKGYNYARDRILGIGEDVAARADSDKAAVMAPYRSGRKAIEKVAADRTQGMNSDDALTAGAGLVPMAPEVAAVAQDLIALGKIAGRQTADMNAIYVKDFKALNNDMAFEQQAQMAESQNLRATALANAQQAAAERSAARLAAEDQWARERQAQIEDNALAQIAALRQQQRAAMSDAAGYRAQIAAARQGAADQYRYNMMAAAAQSASEGGDTPAMQTQRLNQVRSSELYRLANANAPVRVNVGGQEVAYNPTQENLAAILDWAATDPNSVTPQFWSAVWAGDQLTPAQKALLRSWGVQSGTDLQRFLGLG